MMNGELSRIGDRRKQTGKIKIDTKYEYRNKKFTAEAQRRKRKMMLNDE